MGQVNAKNLGVGSLLLVDGLAYCEKGEDGEWRFLDPQKLSFLDWEVDDWVDVEIIREVEYNLRDFPIGSVIQFDKGDVAVRHREDFWKVAGSDEEYTFEQLDNFIFNKNTIKELT